MFYSSSTLVCLVLYSGKIVQALGDYTEYLLLCLYYNNTLQYTASFTLLKNRVALFLKLKQQRMLMEASRKEEENISSNILSFFCLVLIKATTTTTPT